MTEVANLTTMEVNALTDVDGGLNLTDGHARLRLSPQQAAIVAQTPRMFAEASRRPFNEIEFEAHTAFMNAIGQHTAPVGTGRILSCYSSTLATDIVARALPIGSTIAILHPTFDNIADLFLTRGLTLVPLSETALLDRAWPEPPVSAIMLTHPNNPTGLVTPEGHLRSLAEHAARHGQIVILDASFRGQVRDAQYDSYAVFDAAGVDWITIEDTGKLWPTHDLKIGLLAYSTRTKLPPSACWVRCSRGAARCGWPTPAATPSGHGAWTCTCPAWPAWGRTCRASTASSWRPHRTACTGPRSGSTFPASGRPRTC